jgi:EpsI family protein
MTTRQVGIPAAALAVLVGSAWVLRAGQSVWVPVGRAQAASRVLARPSTASLPERLGIWVGTPVAVEADVPAMLETTDVAVMEYRMGREPPVWVSRVGGFGTRAAFHPPELCYIGSDFEVMERQPVTLLVNGEKRRVMRLVLRQGPQSYEAWYWLTANGRTTTSYYLQQLWLVLDAIRRRPLAGTLVRISTPMDGPAASHRRLLAFMTSLADSPTPQRIARHGL